MYYSPEGLERFVSAQARDYAAALGARRDQEPSETLGRVLGMPVDVRGTTDLRNQRFDQTVDVLPKSGGLLTAVGAIAGGPVGAAVGAVANAMLDKPLQGLGAKTYRVTGPWSSPKVEVTTRAPAQPRAAADKPQG